MNTISKGKWDGFSEKAKWDIQVALRGPDCHHSEGIKWFATSVIRGAVSGIMRVGGLVNKDLNLVIIPIGGLGKDDGDAVPRLRWNSSHYFQHVVEAAQWLGIPVVHVQGQEYLSNIGTFANLHSIGLKHLASLRKDREAGQFWAAQPELIAELERHLNRVQTEGYL